MPLSSDEFLSRVADSGVLPDAAVREWLSSLPAADRPADGEQLARLLVKEKQLTAFQAQQIYSGKGKSLVLGNYVLLDKLGQGGMGMVLKAEHRLMKRTVALKVLSPAVTKTAELVARFQREVQAAARLTHPNIVAAFDADEASGTHYLVMEFVDGRDLASVVKQRGPLPVEQALNYVQQTARGLEFAHQHGVIHRDIKPANLLLDSHGTVKILDMGLARIEGDAAGQAELTNTGAVMGTVDYMAPEQALSTKSADARSDIYSLGITLWYLLTGRPAYTGESLMGRMLAHREAPLPSLVAALQRKSSGIAIPGPLDAVFHKMIAKKPADRYQTMTEVLAALAQLQATEAAEIPLEEPAPSEDSRFSAFLAGLQAEGGVTARTTARAANKAPSVTTTEDATMALGHSEATTDPHTLTKAGSRRATASPSPDAGGKPARREPWQDARLLGATAGGVVLLVLLFASLGRGLRGARTTGTTPDPTAAASQTASASPAAKAAPARRGKPALKFEAFGAVEFEKPLDYAPDSCTIEAYVTPAAPGREGYIFMLTGSAGLLTGLNNDQGWRLSHMMTNGHFGVELQQRFELGRRVHLAGVCDRDSYRLYVDGRLAGEAKVRNVTFDPYRSPPQIGPNFRGIIDELRVSRVPRYQADFQPPRRHEADGDTLALYRFDEGEGPTLHDSSGNEFHGHLAGPQWTRLTSVLEEPRSSSTPAANAASGRGKPAVRFDSYDSVGFDSVLNYAADSCTIEAYVTPEATAARAYIVLLSGSSGLGTGLTEGNNWRLSHVMQPNGHFGFDTNQPFVVGRRVHLAGVCAPDGYRLYVDGRLVGQKPSHGQKFAAARSAPKMGLNFIGTIDEVRISKVPRYAAEFQPPRRHEADADTLALYRFDEGQGTVLHDSSGNEFHGWLVGTDWVRLAEVPEEPTPATPAVSGPHALEFDGVDDYVHIPTLAPPDGPFTIEAWIEPGLLASNNIVGLYGPQLHTSIWGSSSLVGFTVATKDWLVAAKTLAGLASGKRSHVAGVYDGALVSFFLDGKKLDDMTSRGAGEPAAPTDGGYFGGLPGTGLWRGQISAVRVSTGARYVNDFTPETRLAAEEQSLALYHFDEGRGDVLTDSSGHNHHGKIVGAQWVRAESSTPRPAATASPGN